MQILITAGGTREYIDPVRFIGNASSGKMGLAIARAALNAGHEVLVIAANVNLKLPPAAAKIDVISSAEMLKAVKENFGSCDCLIMAAAVSDYKPARAAKAKIKKSDSRINLQLVRTADILGWAGRNKNGQLLVGFSLETENLLDNAEQKMRKKKLDMIVANDSSAINASRTTACIKAKDRDWQKVANRSKMVIARRIVELLDRL
jgi:phosphopantothenoylcysteine decarboxylase / phosphopantothenate---cysteine ligase